MFRPLALYVGLRYTRAKRRQHFISFISFASTLGIALGVAVLITVLSVMNGFDQDIRERLFNLVNQVTIAQADGKIMEWSNLTHQVAQQSHIKAVAPFVNSQGILTHQGKSAPLLVTGILPEQEKNVSHMASYITEGSFDALVPQRFGIVIGSGLAYALHLSLGEKVLLLTPQATASPLGILPRYKQFTVIGIFHVPGDPGIDQSFAFIHLHDAQVLYQLGNAVSGLRAKVNDLYDAPAIAEQLERALPIQYTITNWTQEYGTFFAAVRMEKTMIFLLLLLIIAVAAFNLVSTLVMVVNEKQADIAILRTFGVSPATIMTIFIVQGFTLGLVGTLLGLAGGVLLASYVTEVVHFIQGVLHIPLLSSSIYFIDVLPSLLQWADVWRICMIALGLSLLATLYPAWQAARTQPAEALRYE